MIQNNSIIRARKYATEGFLTAGGQVINFAGTVILLKLTTTWLTPLEYGHLALFLTFVNLANKVATGGAINAASRFYPEATKNGQEAFYFASIRLLLTRASLLIGITSVIAASAWGFGKTSTGLSIIFLGILSISSAVGASLNAINIAKRDRSSSVIYYLRLSLLRVFITLITLIVSDPSATSVLFAFALSSSVSTLIELNRYREEFGIDRYKNIQQNNIHLKWRENIWKYAWPFSAWGVFTWLQEAADKWSLDAFFGASEVGIYAAAYQIGFMPIVLAVGTVNELFSPIINAQSEKPGGREDNKIVLLISGGWIILIVFAYLFTLAYSSEIFSLVAAPSFATGADLLPYFVLLGGGQAIFSTLNLKLNSLKVSKPRLYLNVVCACIGSIFIFIGASAAGINGVIAAMGFTYAVKITWEIALVRRHTSTVPISNHT